SPEPELNLAGTVERADPGPAYTLEERAPPTGAALTASAFGTVTIRAQPMGPEHAGPRPDARQSAPLEDQRPGLDGRQLRCQQRQRQLMRTILAGLPKPCKSWQSFRRDLMRHIASADASAQFDQLRVRAMLGSPQMLAILHARPGACFA